MQPTWRKTRTRSRKANATSPDCVNLSKAKYIRYEAIRPLSVCGRSRCLAFRGDEYNSRTVAYGR